MACSTEVVETPPTPGSNVDLSLDDVNRQRDAKLRRREQMDEMQRLMSELRKNLDTLEHLRNSRGKGQLTRKGKERLRAEKTMRRSHAVTSIRWLANSAIDELEAMDCEKMLINYMADLELGPTFFQEELKSQLGELPHVKTAQPVLISNGQFLDDAGSVAASEQLRKMLHGNLYDIVFQNPLVPFPPTPQPSTVEVTPPEEVGPPVIVEEEEVEEPKPKEEEPKTKEVEKHDALRVEDGENKKVKGKKKKA